MSNVRPYLILLLGAGRSRSGWLRCVVGEHLVLFERHRADREDRLDEALLRRFRYLDVFGQVRLERQQIVVQRAVRAVLRELRVRCEVRQMTVQIEVHVRLDTEIAWQRLKFELLDDSQRRQRVHTDLAAGEQHKQAVRVVCLHVDHIGAYGRGGRRQNALADHLLAWQRNDASLSLADHQKKLLRVQRQRGWRRQIGGTCASCVRIGAARTRTRTAACCGQTARTRR